jgi:hypothetical protein
VDDFNIGADVIDYLGKYENGILVLLSINFNDEFTEGILYYSDTALTLTVDESVEKQLNHPIEYWSGYKKFLESILKKVVPYDEIITRIDDIDFSKYSMKSEDVNLGEDIDNIEIKTED